MEYSRFFDSTQNDQRSYSAEDFAEYLRAFYSDGIILNNPSAQNAGNLDLKVTSSPSSLAVTVNAGCAMIRGYWYKSEGSTSLSVNAANSIYPRIDRVVLRLDLSARKISLKVLPGTPSAVPTAPALVRGENVYDLALARLIIPANATVITSVIDERSDSSVCGYMQGHYTVGLQEFQTQLNGIIAEAESKGDEAVNLIKDMSNAVFHERMLTLDGSNSGLDADLLDGQHGSYYLNYLNLSNRPSIESLGGRAIFTGTAAPSSTLGKDGDIYIQHS